MTQLITGAPIWVWPLLAVLVFVGMRARHDRTVPEGLIYGLPLLGGMAVRSVAVLPAAAAIWLVFAAAYALGVWGGYLLQRGWLLGWDGGKVRLAGESLTLSVMMLVFWANFAGGFMQAVVPDAYGSATFHVIFAALLAASCGSFAGRALRVWTMRHGTAFPIGGTVCNGAPK